MMNYDEVPAILTCLGNMKELKQKIAANSADGVLNSLLKKQSEDFQKEYKGFMAEVETAVKEKKPEVKKDKEALNLYKGTIQSMITDLVNDGKLEKAGKMPFQNVGSITYSYEKTRSVSLPKEEKQKLVEYFVDMGMLDVLTIDDTAYIALSDSLEKTGESQLQGIITEEKVDVKIVQ